MRCRVYISFRGQKRGKIATSFLPHIKKERIVNGCASARSSHRFYQGETIRRRPFFPPIWIHQLYTHERKRNPAAAAATKSLWSPFFFSLLLPPHTTCDAFMLILCAAAAAGAQEPLRKARKKGNLKTLVATWLFMFVYLPVLLWQKENSCQLWMDFVLFFKTKETRHCVRVKRRVKLL